MLQAQSVIRIEFSVRVAMEKRVMAYQCDDKTRAVEATSLRTVDATSTSTIDLEYRSPDSAQQSAAQMTTNVPVQFGGMLPIYREFAVPIEQTLRGVYDTAGVQALDATYRMNRELRLSMPRYR